jgi:threonine synthase
MAWKGLIDKYGDRMEIAKDVPPVTLYEGNTPLIPIPTISREIASDCEIFVKYEGLNPTGSFKDRGMTAAITQAVADGANAVICASTGNTAASAAAYAARASLKCAVLIPEGKVAIGKLAGAIAYGADVIAIQGSFDDALTMVREISKTFPIALVNSVNPARLEGQKTASWELIDQLGSPPDWLCLPVGNAGNISAYWLGFLQSDNDKKPRILGAQAAGAAPIVNGHVVEKPETVATAIRIGNPARWVQALDALEESNGEIHAVTDKEILVAQRLLATKEGIYCEPSSAAGLAGLLKSVREGSFNPNGKRIVIVLTGHGMKDPDTTISQFTMQPTIPSSLEALRNRLEAK